MKWLAAAALAFFAFAGHAGACQCGSVPAVAEALNDADVVAMASVSQIEDPYNWWRRFKAWLGIRPEVRDKEEYEKLYGLRVVLSVSRGFKGVSEKSLTVITGRGGGDCGYYFQVGSQYLVYAARGRDGLLRTSICTRTKAASAAGGDLAAIEAIERRP